MHEWQSLLETTENTRDLGGYAARDGKTTQTFRFLRSEVVKAPSENDIRFLQDHGIHTVVDLRHDARVKQIPHGLSTVPGFSYYHCSCLAGSRCPEDVSLVPDMYMQIAESDALCRAFHIFAEAPAGVIFNCSAGKDRTGVTAAVLLLLAGVSDEDIMENYLKSAECEGIMEMTAGQFPDKDPRCYTPLPRHMEGFLKLFREKYGTAEGYLQTYCGLREEEIETIRKKLLD